MFLALELVASLLKSPFLGEKNQIVLLALYEHLLVNVLRDEQEVLAILANKYLGLPWLCDWLWQSVIKFSDSQVESL
eukprot:11991312-Ditylum_brightwellii.AAC.1